MKKLKFLCVTILTILVSFIFTGCHPKTVATISTEGNGKIEATYTFNKDESNMFCEEEIMQFEKLLSQEKPSISTYKVDFDTTSSNEYNYLNVSLSFESPLDFDQQTNMLLEAMGEETTAETSLTFDDKEATLKTRIENIDILMEYTKYLFYEHISDNYNIYLPYDFDWYDSIYTINFGKTTVKMSSYELGDNGTSDYVILKSSYLLENSTNLKDSANSNKVNLDKTPNTGDRFVPIIFISFALIAISVMTVSYKRIRSK